MRGAGKIPYGKVAKEYSLLENIINVPFFIELVAHNIWVFKPTGCATRFMQVANATRLSMQTYIIEEPPGDLEHQERNTIMRMQEPEQWPSSEAPGTTGQEYGTYRAETGQNALGQKIFPQESRVSVLSVLIIVFSAIGFCPAIASVLALYDNGPQAGGFFFRLLSNGLLGSIVVLLLLATIFVLPVITVVRRAARFRPSRFH